MPAPMRDHGAPLREARAHAGVLGEPLAQAVEAFGDLLAGEAGERLGAGVDLDAGNDAGLLAAPARTARRRASCWRIVSS